jgi:hypothetical protein
MMPFSFSRYFKRGEVIDVSEYLRNAAAQEKPPVLSAIYLSIISSNLDSYRKFLYETQVNIENIVKLGASSSFIIEINLPQPYFVKHLEQLKVTYVQSLRQTQDGDPRSSSILGALRWGLEKYVILKIATLDPSGFGDFTEAWLTSRGVKIQKKYQVKGVEVQDKSRQEKFKRLVERFALYYPPNIVFGTSGVGEAQRSGERVIGSVRGAVSVTRLEGCGGFVRLEFSLDPPPITYRILGELGVVPRDVKKALASLLAVAAAMLSPSEMFDRQAPVPLTTNLEDSSRQRVCVETPYEVDLNLVDCIIESFWCKVKNI